jgi:hypothetical protein
MQLLKKIGLLAFIFLGYYAQSQKVFTYESVNTESYSLYEKSAWKELLAYGKEAINNNQDFAILRLRMGYAAFMLNNFSEAIKHYEVVLKNDSYNSTAHYYIYFSRKYLGQHELGTAESRYLSKEILEQEHLKPFAFSNVGFELSYKNTDVVMRGNPMYARLDIGNRFSPNFHMLQSVATYQQKIKEPLLTGVMNNNNININQFEYYNRIMLNLDKHWQLKGAYHFIHTPFNNLIYNNNLALLGVKYNGTYFNIQADGVMGKLTDSTIKQYNLQLGLYPFGNLNFYSFSTASVRQQGQSAFNFRQVLGTKLMKNIWLEGNITLGTFSNLLENDALYVYNAIDPNKFKGGLTSYITLFENMVVQLGYTFEQRQLYKKTINYNQHSITGGISWKF